MPLKSALIVTILALLISPTIWFLFNNSCKYFQFVQEYYTIGHSDIDIELHGLSINFALFAALIAPIFTILLCKSSCNSFSMKQSSFPLVEFIIISGLVNMIAMIFDDLYMWITSDYIACDWEKWFAYNHEIYNKALPVLSSGDLYLLKSTYKLVLLTIEQNNVFLVNTKIILYDVHFSMKELHNLVYFELYIEDFSKLLASLKEEINRLS